ncbi:MAG TPA: flagellar basal body P-ring protein FlgI, partial [Tepidisphaeraceae bacterium]
MRRSERNSTVLKIVAASALGVALLCGCQKKQPPPKAQKNYDTRPAKAVPAYLKGSILEAVDLENTDPFPISGYSLVTRLWGTGDSKAPAAVRDYVIKEMVKHGLGGFRVQGYEQLQPEAMLRDPSVAIVRVDGNVPAGARSGDRFDVLVSALANNDTSSLIHGALFATDLKVMGADVRDPAGVVNVFGKVDAAQIFVNPAYTAAGTADQSAAAKASLRIGTVLNGGRTVQDRPLILRLRAPQYSMARAIERRVDMRFQGMADMSKPNGERSCAFARDEGIVYIYPPHGFNGDWEHFAGVATHLYMNEGADFVAAKAKELADAAAQPKAPLSDISYCWEALGVRALPFIQPLMASASPDVAYAAARAAAYLGELSAQDRLAEMALTPKHPFQLNAVQTLGNLPESPSIVQKLHKILDSDQTLARIEAYQVLARQGGDEQAGQAGQGGNGIDSHQIGGKFMLDIVPTAGAPMIYASRTGMPRIAVFGRETCVQNPVTFFAMGKEFSMSSPPEGGNLLALFHRPPALPNAKLMRPPVKQFSRPSLPEVIARLGGEGASTETHFDFSYSDIIGMLQAMSDSQILLAPYNG